MRVEVPAADDPRTLIELGVGDDIIAVPRFDFIGEDDIDAIQADIDAIDADMAPHRQQREAILIHFRRFADPGQVEALEALKLGQLKFMMDTWTEKSSIPLGEFLVSADSSAESTAKRSKRTS